MSSRRNFIKGSVGLVAGAGALPVMATNVASSPVKEERKKRLPLFLEEKAKRLTIFDPAGGVIPNPGMGISAFVHSD